ncbi:MAG TPA: DegQ family serine endoprotease [Gammaproteobacteria bacterium]|nr:DegQ family serine endoprotease [Gammaproteobacteria bacterium]
MTHVQLSTTVRRLPAGRALALLSALLASQIALGQPARELPTLAPMIETISPAVVNIAVTSSLTERPGTQQDELLRRFFDFEGPPGRQREVEGAGSGVIVDAAKGYILTNHHVIANADKITVTLAENRSLTARIVGSDEDSDLAVLQVEAANLKSIPFGDSATLRVGDYVIAIGNPFGFSNSVTSGIVSALGRSGLNSQAYEDFIQTDASINPGNSGGALVNLNGELVGINSAIISRTGGNVGIGFAIPVNMVRPVMDQLIATGTVRRGLLGVNIQDVTPDLAATYGLAGNSGALVTRVTENSAAERANIQINDVIVSINGKRLRDSGSLRNFIGLLQPGESVAVGLIRDGREQTLTAVLGANEPTAPVAAARPEKDKAELDSVFEGADLVDNATANGSPGLLVARVDPGSPAFERGLRPGDIITKVNRVRVRTLADAVPLMETARAIILEVQRGTRSQLILMR